MSLIENADIAKNESRNEFQGWGVPAGVVPDPLPPRPTLEEIKAEIAATRSFDRLRVLVAGAETLRKLAKAIGASLAQQIEIAVVKIDGERRMGSMLAETVKHKGGRPKTDHSALPDSTPTLADLGVGKMQAHRWQTMAELSSERLERHVEDVKKKAKELTSAGVYQLARRIAAKETLPVAFRILPNEFPTEHFCPRCRYRWAGTSMSRPVLDVIAKGAGVSLETAKGWFRTGKRGDAGARDNEPLLPDEMVR